MNEEVIICPHCNEGVLHLVEEVFPWSPKHWICNNCDYPEWEFSK